MTNRLAGETSPYLLQHADNPVDWHPWGEEALTLARDQGKPILLSIGYSACHWCHVMAHESFEDPEVAQVMNEHFVNVKVDREERPDLDQIYQSAHYLLTRRSGGWPLTMFLTPEQKPFFGGTYFPKEPRYGLPGFRDLLGRVAGAYRGRRADIEEQNDALLEALAQTVTASGGGGALSGGPLAQVVPQLKGSFDMVHGGFGGAPKFPHPPELALCLRRHARAGSGDALHMAALTLEKMALGGIHDQLGGGFCRYSVDELWAIPHFEKMLYDNGQLLRLYADAWRATRSPLFERVVRETAGWVMREMQSPEGGYTSSLDADSEHEEGRFYVWTPGEAEALLSADEYAVAAAHYGLDGPPNFEGSHWHLTVRRPLEEVAESLGRPGEECTGLLASARRKLFEARERRMRPGRDDKVLTSWNALMIAGMARAGRVFGRDDWLDSAGRALAYVRGSLWREGRLLATCKDGRAHLNAYLDDYAFLLDAVLEMLQARFDAARLEFAVALAEALLERFEDHDAGGFFFTSHDHERLILRPKPAQDQATPAGNGVAAGALLRLGHLLGEARYLEAARRTLEHFFPLMERHPPACAGLLAALDEQLAPPTVVILRGPEQEMARWQAALSREHLPATLVLAVPPGGPLPEALDKPIGAAVNAWVCRGVECLPPSGDLAAVLRVCKDGELG